MNFYCPNCKAYYTQPDEQIPAAGMTVKCLDCGTLIALPGSGAASEAAAAAPAAEDDAETFSAGPGFEGIASPGSTARARPVLLGGGGRPRDLEQEMTVPSLTPDGSDFPLPPVLARRQEALIASEAPTTKDPAGAPAPAPEGRAPAAVPSAPAAPAFAVRWPLGLLWLALRAAFSPRRVLELGLGLFLSQCLVLALAWVAATVESGALRAGTTVLALALGWISLSLLAASTSATLGPELRGTGVVPLSRGLRWSLEHLPSVTLTPLAPLALGLTFVLGEALLHLLGLIPELGRVLYGLLIPVSLLLALLAVSSLLLAALVGWLYLPELQRADEGPVATARRVASLLQRQGWGAGLLLGSSVVLGLLLAGLLASVAFGALGLTCAMGVGMLGEDFFSLLAGAPAGLQGPAVALAQLLGATAPAAAVPGFEAAGLLLALGLLLWSSLLSAVLLAYACGASIVAHALLADR